MKKTKGENKMQKTRKNEQTQRSNKMKQSFISVIQAKLYKKLSENFLDLFYKKYAGVNLNFKINDIENHGNSILIVYSSVKTDDDFVEIRIRNCR